MTERAGLITFFKPEAVGHGGNHRSYQLLFELAEIFGTNAVNCLALPDWKSWPAPGPLALWSSRLLRRMFRFASNPLKPFGGSPLDLFSTATPQIRRRVDDLLSSNPRVLVVDHPSLAWVVHRAGKLHIPVVFCPQNIESLELLADRTGSSYCRQLEASVDLLHELRILRGCPVRLMISRLEAEFLTGLGIPASFYPYRPVGEIRARMMKIRRRRAEDPSRAFVVVVGSAGHTSTAASMRSLVGSLTPCSVPQKIVIVGSGTGEVLQQGPSQPGTSVEARGWVAQEQFDELLSHATAVVVPQDRGFGAVTRLSEMSCAGIPVIASSQVAAAGELPPGVATADLQADGWEAVGRRIAEPLAGSSASEYRQWEEKQPCALREAVQAVPARPGTDTLGAGVEP